MANSRTVKTPGGLEMPIINLKGKDYLEVKWRLVWFREVHPDWRILTEIVSHDDQKTIMAAKVYDTANNLMAMGHKSETKQGFGDHLEKAETGAIGRALALLGYGTQFTDDLDEGDRLADSPVAPRPPVPIKPALDLDKGKEPAFGAPVPPSKDVLKELVDKNKQAVLDSLNKALVDLGFEGDARTQLLDQVFRTHTLQGLQALKVADIMAGVVKINSMQKKLPDFVADMPHFDNFDEPLPF